MTVLLGVDADSGRIVGFGAWRISVASRPDPAQPERRLTERYLYLTHFGVSQELQGVSDENDETIAARLYASVEEDMKAAPRTEPPMPIYLICDVRNARGGAFWEKMGYRHLGPTRGNPRFHDYVRSPW
ncbi:MAG: hypothetical protein M3R46_01490 [Actinomycetota bacterium]|nr:hypothetical protein [Actinomycetota bacterium]